MTVRRLDLPATSPRATHVARSRSGRADDATLVGRDAEIRLLAGRIERARRGLGGLLVIEGEAGSGKTTILDEVVRRAAGLSVFRSSGHEIDRDRPFGVIADALAIGITSPDPERSAIARSLRGDGTDRLDEALRYRVLEDILSLLERAALSRPVLIALDDIHSADAPSILALHHLARRITHLPVCLVATRRPTRSLGGIDHLDELTADPGTDRISLQPLDQNDVVRLASRILGVAPGDSLQALLTKAGGNPFFVTELLAALREDRSIDIHGSEAEVAITDVRPELRMVILRRLGGLAPATVRMLRMASILGGTFSALDLAIALGSTAVDLVDPLEEAMAAGVLTAENDRLTFRHDLVREALYGDVPASIRSALHLQVADALRRSGATASRCAPHFAAGAAFGDHEAIECLRLAAADLVSTEPATARRWAARALELLSPADPRHDAIVAESCWILLRLGDAVDAETLAREALARPQPPDLRSALHRALAESLDYQDRCLEAAAESARERDADDLDEVERVRFAAEAVEYRVHVEPVAAEPAARELLQRALAVGDEVATRRLLGALHHVATWRADHDEAVKLAERLIARTARASMPEIITGGLLGRALARAGRTDDALRSLRSELSDAEARRDLRPMALILTELAAIEAQAGRWDEAVSDAEAAVGLASEFRQDIRYDEALAQLVILAVRRDGPDRAARLLASMRGVRRFIGASAAAKVADATGEPRRALHILREAWELAVATSRRSDFPRYAPDLVRLELAVGDRGRADEAVRSVEEIAGATRVAWITATALRCRGLVDADPAPLLEAVDVARAADLADQLAATLEDAGMMLASAGAAPGAAAGHLQEAASYYEAVGASYDQRRVEAGLRALGVRRGKRGPRPRAKTGPASLTETERRVIELAAEGLTNAEIGARMFISGRTVERHLTHVYSKLAIGSRVELAALAAEVRPQA